MTVVEPSSDPESEPDELNPQVEDAPVEMNETGSLSFAALCQRDNPFLSSSEEVHFPRAAIHPDYCQFDIDALEIAAPLAACPERIGSCGISILAKPER